MSARFALGRDMGAAICEKVGLDPNQVADIVITADPNDLVRIQITKLATEDEAELVLSYIAELRGVES